MARSVLLFPPISKPYLTLHLYLFFSLGSARKLKTLRSDLTFHSGAKQFMEIYFQMCANRFDSSILGLQKWLKMPFVETVIWMDGFTPKQVYECKHLSV